MYYGYLCEHYNIIIIMQSTKNFYAKIYVFAIM